MKFQWRLSLSAILISTIISGCSVSTTSTKPTLTAAEQDQQRVESLLKKANSAKPIKSAQYRADAAKILLGLGRKQEAAAVLKQIDVALLAPSLRFEITKLQAEAALEQNQPEQALQQLDRLNGLSDLKLPTEQEIQILELRAQAFQLQQQHFNEAKELIRLSQLLDTDAAKQILHDQIWNSLLKIEAIQLSELIRSGTNSYHEQGWLELAYELSVNTQLDTQNQALNNWAVLWESHPAQKLPPQSLSGLGKQTLSAQKIAVLLPLEGKLAKPANAIKEGIMMAHLRSQQPSKTSPELLFLDSEKINTPIQLASIVNEQQVDMIIGPLAKDYVTTLAADQHIQVPVLALNYTDSPAREGMYQFGLSAEDEAIQIAERAWKDGIRRAAVLTPNSGWGEKISKAFEEHFTSLGGMIVHSSNFGDISEFSEHVSQFLSTDKSKQRYKNLRKVVYTHKIEFEEHRRHDMEAIILTALPNDARQLNTMLAFNFAGDLPIYATSHVFSGSNNPIQDQDLNNVTFLGTPWNLKPPSQDKVLISQQRNDTNSRFGRLYALGLDAYRIHPYLKQLSAVPGTQINGETGQLSINNNGLVFRTLTWAQYKDGIPQIIE